MKQLVFLLFITVNLACTKDTDKEAPAIILLSPLSGQNFKTTDTFSVRAMITDNAGLQSVKFRRIDSFMTKAMPGFGTEDINYDASGSSYSLNKFYDIGIDFRNTWRCTIFATDKAGNQAYKEFVIYLNQ